jgi:proteasome lid subunit RPN8/RPN11
LLGSRDNGRGSWSAKPQRFVEGEKSEVNADWSWTMAREEEVGDVMGFYHTHPKDSGTRPSSRDIRTMRAWCSALGKPLLCLIAEEPDVGLPSGHVFKDDEHRGSPVDSIDIDEEGVFTIMESVLAAGEECNGGYAAT